MKHRNRIAVISCLALVAIVPAGTAVGSGGPCAGDVNDSGAVDINDLIQMLGVWGACPGCPEDIDLSGDVGVSDLLVLLGTWGPCAGVTERELAGISLGDFPSFDFVRTFTEGSIVEVAVDPGNLPDGGLTGDLFIVAARTAAEWEADDTLIDVRGNAQSATFNGPTIQTNTVALIDSFTLDGDGGIAFGVDYDVVLDVNTNGLLDDGDIIDGLDGTGFTVVDDTTALGPWSTSTINYSGGAWLGQRTWYPIDIDSMSPRPLVVISHGNGHNYQWYDYLQEHLASHGYVVMSHENNTGPGIESASTTTLTNTDYFLGNLAAIGGGVLDGHIDSSRITWIGHSRGGEGVARAYDRLFDDDFVPDDYSIDDIVLISSIAPNDYLGRFQSNPHGATYHLLIGAADGDNGGWPNLESDAPFHVFERAEGYRQATNVHGADHNDFNCCGFNDFQGPAGTEIGRLEAQRVAKALYLALIAHYVDGNLAARDFLWRQDEVLRPIGVDTDTIVAREYIEGPNPGAFVLDDFQTETSLSTSSSGGAVSGDVFSRAEARHDDTDGTFTWSAGDPMNGMSRGRTDDLSRGTVFDWTPGFDLFLEFDVVAAGRDMTQWTYLTFRACQGTRHPQTTDELGDTSFSVTLHDGAGTTATIDFGAYGAGLQEPYQRTGSGRGAGWQNEYQTIRIRLTDFLHNGSQLDLTDVVAVRFDVGASFGSSRGRVAVDDLALSGDAMPPSPAGPRLPGGPEPEPTERPEWLGGDIPPAAPSPVIELVAAQAFTLAEPYIHHWRYEQPLVSRGHLLVLQIDPAMVHPTQSLEPVLYVGDQTAERLLVRYESGYLVAIVPGEVDLSEARIWFGSPALPEQVGEMWIGQELGRAIAAGLEPVPASTLMEAMQFGTRVDLLDYAAGLMKRHAPTEPRR